MLEYVARTEAVVLDVLDGGAMVYDTRSDQAHWLDHDALAIWRACAQRATEAHIVRGSGVDPLRCSEALDRLADVGLVVRHGGISRRSALATAARVGAAGVVGAPVITALIPAATAHAGTPGTGGGGGNPPPPPVTTTFTANGTFVLAPSQVATYTLIGGGGGAGFYSGVGGSGGSISGTITNLSSSPQTLAIVIGQASNGGGGGVGYGNGGQGGNYGLGGGSASAILDGTTALVIAGGGGGGGAYSSGGNGGASTGTSTVKADGGDGQGDGAGAAAPTAAALGNPIRAVVVRTTISAPTRPSPSPRRAAALPRERLARPAPVDKRPAPPAPDITARPVRRP